jgi:hypothetical protein
MQGEFLSTRAVVGHVVKHVAVCLYRVALIIVVLAVLVSSSINGDTPFRCVLKKKSFSRKYVLMYRYFSSYLAFVVRYFRSFLLDHIMHFSKIFKHKDLDYMHFHFFYDNSSADST